MPLKILTVDDKNTIRMIVKRAFKPYDCEILEAKNGSEALEKIYGEKPDVILLDVDMPVMDGMDVLKQLRNEPEIKNIPVIMLTAEADRNVVISIMKMGVKGYLVKPFKINELIQRVQSEVTLVSKEESGIDELRGRYFKTLSNTTVLNVPNGFSKAHQTRLIELLPGQLKKTAGKGMNGLVLNLNAIRTADVQAVKLILKVLDECRRVNLPSRIVAKKEISEQLKELEETAHITTFPGVDQAIADLSGVSPT